MYGNLDFSFPLFSITFSIRDHDHKYALSIAFQTLMNVLTIYITVLVILDLLEMDTSAMITYSTACLI